MTTLRRWRNEQPAGSSILHFQYVLPLSTYDAEDFYGWTPADGR